MTKPKPRADLRIRASYTTTEMAHMLSLSRWQFARMVKRRGIEVDRTGRPHRVWLAQFKRCAPEVWESVLTVAHLAGAA